jgi:hypothetical protein
MLNFLEYSLAQNNVETIILLTENNAPAAKFYEQKEFKASSHTVFLYKNIYERG